MGCITIFTVSSALCGAATSLGMLLAARVIQGIGGGVLQPIAQAVLLKLPVGKRGQAMAIYGMGIIVAPIIGPTLGGWITDNYSWRWIFYINVPVGVAAVFMVQAFVENPPYLQRGSHRSIDYIGFGLIGVVSRYPSDYSRQGARRGLVRFYLDHVVCRNISHFNDSVCYPGTVIRRSNC